MISCSIAFLVFCVVPSLKLLLILVVFSLLVRCRVWWGDSLDVDVGEGLAAAAAKLVVDEGIVGDAVRGGVVIVSVGACGSSVGGGCEFVMRGRVSVGAA